MCDKSKDELLDIVVKPLTGDRIGGGGIEPPRAEDGADDRRRGKEGVETVDGKPAANGEKQENDDTRLHKTQDGSQELIDDAEGSHFIDKAAKTLIEKDGGQLDDEDEKDEGDGDRDPFGERTPEQHGGRRSRRDDFDGRERSRDDDAVEPTDAELLQNSLYVCACNIRGNGGRQHLFMKTIC